MTSPKWHWNNVLFSKISLSLKKEKNENNKEGNSPLPERITSLFFLNYIIYLSFLLFLFICILFRELFLPRSPKYVMKWWIILKLKGFVARKISPLRGIREGDGYQALFRRHCSMAGIQEKGHLDFWLYCSFLSAIFTL